MQDRGGEPPLGAGQGPVEVGAGGGEVSLRLPHSPPVGQGLGVVRTQGQGAVEVGGGLGQVPHVLPDESAVVPRLGVAIVHLRRAEEVGEGPVRVALHQAGDGLSVEGPGGFRPLVTIGVGGDADRRDLVRHGSRSRRGLEGLTSRRSDQEPPSSTSRGTRGAGRISDTTNAAG